MYTCLQEHVSTDICTRVFKSMWAPMNRRVAQKSKTGFTNVSARQNLKYDNGNNVHANRNMLLEYFLFAEEGYLWIRKNTISLWPFISTFLSSEYR